MKDQALQYDSGKYYYIENCPKKPCKDKCESSSYCLDNCEKEYVWNDQIKSARIEVAPESLVFANQIIGNSLDIEPVNKKLTSSDYWVFEFSEGIYPVQVKVEIRTAKWVYDEEKLPEKVLKQYAILSEPDKWDELEGSGLDTKLKTWDQNSEPKSGFPDVESILKNKGMKSIEWAMQEYGRQLIDYVAKNVKVKTIIPVEEGCRMFTDAYQDVDRDAILAIKELITP